jgi:hypothetical protein
MKTLYVLLAALLVLQTTCAFVVSPTKCKASTRLFAVERDKDGNIKKGPLDFIMDPKPTKIPPELKDEIYKAEGNTEAARQRQGRVATYTALAVLLVGCAFCNVFITEFRATVAEAAGKTSVSLDDVGWGWVEMNFLFKFLLANKIGGGVALMAGAGSGMMVEAEVDSQRENAEKIWDELERRREKKESSKRKKKKVDAGPPPSKKKGSGTQKKRLAALSELVVEDEEVAVETYDSIEVGKVTDVAQKDDGLMGKLKGWYAEADSMAASQALLLNKELEDKGVLDKITDETGLRVIGKDAAAKLQEEESEKKK